MKTKANFLATIVATVILLTASRSGAALIISQYYEGSGNDKWIEIYNTDSTAVDLGAANIRVALWSNAAREGWKTSVAPTASVALSGTIAGYSTFLLRHSSAVNPTYATANQISGTVINFNGDDSFAIWQSADATFSTSELLDVFGLTGNSAQDVSYSRNPANIAATLSDFDSALWDQFTLAAVNGASPGVNERLGEFTPVPEPTNIALGVFGIGLIAFSSARAMGKKRSAKAESRNCES